jgi:hypothetical protein
MNMQREEGSSRSRGNDVIRVMGLALSLLLVSACAHQTGGVAASSIPLAPGGYRVLGQAFGRDCVFNLFGLIPLTGGNTTHEAVSRALARSPGADALISVSADTYSQWWIVLTNTCTVVHGTAVSVNEAPQLKLTKPR